MSASRNLPFSIPLLLLDAVGVLLMGAGLATHFAALPLLPAVLAPWALQVAGFGFLLHIPFTLDLLRRARARQQAAQPAAQAPVVRRR